MAQRSPRSLFASRFSRACAVPCSLFRPLGALTGYAPPYIGWCAARRADNIRPLFISLLPAHFIYILGEVAARKGGDLVVGFFLLQSAHRRRRRNGVLGVPFKAGAPLYAIPLRDPPPNPLVGGFGGVKVLLAQRSPRSLFASRFSLACAVPCSLFRPLGALTGYAPPYSKEQKVEHLIRRLTATPSSCGAQKFLRHSPHNRKRAPCVKRLALRRYA